LQVCPAGHRVYSNHEIEKAGVEPDYKFLTVKTSPINVRYMKHKIRLVNPGKYVGEKTITNHSYRHDKSCLSHKLYQRLD